MTKKVDTKEAWTAWQTAVKMNDRQAAVVAFRAMQDAKKEAA